MNKSLGKGLGALIAAFDEENENIRNTFSLDEVESAPLRKQPTSIKGDPTTTPTVVGKTVQEVGIDLIDNNINQPRKSFDAVALQELADSIASNGIFQPLLVNRVGSRYLIVAGERRWRAAKIAGLTTVPVVVRDYSPKQVAQIALVENLQREDLNEMELARGIKKLMDEHFLTQEKVAAVLGKNRSSVANTLRLLFLPLEVQQMVESRQLSAGHAKCLAAVTNIERCVRLARQTVLGGLSVRELEDIIRDDGLTKAFPPVKKQSAELRQAILELNQSLGTKVKVQGDDKRGKIVIEYYDKKDLERLVQRLTSSL